MKIAFFLRLLVCCIFSGIFLYVYVNKKNTVTKLQMTIPVLTAELSRRNEEIEALRFIVDRFESPENLMNLASLPEYGHLRQPLESEIVHLNLDEN
ncbi:MAG: hypothetical protein RSB82_02500 [Victivallaceae bacterium]